MTPKRKKSFDPKSFLAQVGDGHSIGKYGKGQVVFSQGDTGDAVFFIQKGQGEDHRRLGARQGSSRGQDALRPRGLGRACGLLRIIIAGPVPAAGQAAHRSSIHTTAGSTHTPAGSADTTPGALATSSIADRTSGQTGSPTAHCIASRRR